ncbi:MAG: hypothetical protein H8F28_03410 [Fibrella sp.]|nr:hypothetical protein [Armatimonadota bacterium]
MGFSVSYLAVRGKSHGEVLNELNSQMTRDIDDALEAPFSCSTGYRDWFILFANSSIYACTVPLAQLSLDCEIVTCSVEEHVMFSQASLWKDGEEKWSLTHDAQQSITHLDSIGELPGVFVPLFKAAQYEQQMTDDVDFFFDIPVNAAKAMIGFRYDESDGEPFFVVVPSDT